MISRTPTTSNRDGFLTGNTNILRNLIGYAGNITVRSFLWFAARISTMDIKNGIAEYRKINGYSPDVVIIDSMNMQTDATTANWVPSMNTRSASP